MGGGHQETATSLREWVEGEGVRRLALVEEELQQTLAWDQASGLQGGAGEARASPVEH